MYSTDTVTDHRPDVLVNNARRPFSRVHLPENLIDKYFDLPLPADKILATYVWIDGTGENLRWKDRTLDFIPKAPKDKFTRLIESMYETLMEETFKKMTYSQYEKYLPPYYCPRNLENIYRVECRLRTARNENCFDENFKDLPVLTYDGSATKQARRTNSDMYLFPRAIYRNPLRQGNHILVMCDTYDVKMEPTATNHRAKCSESYAKSKEAEPWFGIEQELFFMNCSDSRPLGWPKGGFPKRSNKYYCNIGADKIFGRDLINTHYRCCLFAGIPLCGTNSEIGPSQWEYQVGPSVGVNAGDDIWMARFIMEMLAQEYGVLVSMDPKPIPNWSGSGAHTNFSTKDMREGNGIEEIEKAIDKLEKVHIKHIKVYDPHGGKDNARRLTGEHETDSITSFCAGIAQRFCSIRIPRVVADEKRGYFEDRRPSSNCDPYAVIDMLMRTCILNE